MRILQLDIGDQRVEFHPYVSVLRGLDGDLHDELLTALAAVSSGRPTVEGLVEAHGVLLDLNDETLKLLDLQGAGNGHFDVVVRRDQLPALAGADGSGGPAQMERARADAASRVTRAEADADRANVALAASRSALGGQGGVDLDAPRAELARLTQRRKEVEAAVSAARAAHREAQEAQSRAEERVEQARILRAEAARACSVAAGALESARAVRDPFATAALEAARERLAALEAAVAERTAAERSGDDAPAVDLTLAFVDPEFDDPGVAVEALEARALELEASLLALDTVDPYPVQTALDQLRSKDAESELVPSEEAALLADELERAGGPVADQTAPDLTGGSAMAAARKRLADARAGLFDAERDIRLPEVDRGDADALEHAHEQVLVAQERIDRRFGAAKARERLEQARLTEQEILDRLGFNSYTDFFVGTSVTNNDPERERRLESARGELAAAEDAVAALEASIEAELARAALLARRRELQGRAIELLGRDAGGDVIWALRHHRVRVHDSTARADRLKEALESAGVMIGDEPVPEKLLVEIAHIWLDEQSQTVDRREQLFHELADVQSRLSVAREMARMQRDAQSPEEAEAADREQAGRRHTQLEDAAAAVQAAEQRLARQADIEADVAQRRAELEEATRTEAAVAAALVTAEAEAADAAEAEHMAASERARRETDLHLAESAERQAADTLGTLSDRLIYAAETGEGELERAVAEAQAAADEAAAALEAARATLASIDAQLAADDGDTLVTPAPAGSARVEELEWYLLSRVAAQRSVSYAGSVPLVLDDALAEVGGEDLVHLLSRLERMSTAVQVIVLSDDDAVAAWAESIGDDRAMALSPTSV